MNQFVITKRTELLEIVGNGISVKFSKQMSENGDREVQTKALYFNISDQYIQHFGLITDDEINEILRCLKYIDDNQDHLTDFTDISYLSADSRFRIGAKYMKNKLYGYCEVDGTGKTVWFSFREKCKTLVHMFNTALVYINQ